MNVTPHLDYSASNNVVTAREREAFQMAIKEYCLVFDTPAVRVIASDETTRSQWLFDFRALLLQPQWLSLYAKLFWERHGNRYPFQVCGMETAAISLIAAIVLEGLNRGTPVNGLYVRKSRKRQGLLRDIEGTPTSDPVVIVDDLINNAITKVKLVAVLEAAGLRVVASHVILAFRAETAYHKLTSKEIDVTSEFTLKDFGLPLLTTNTGEISEPGTFTVNWKFSAPQPSLNLVVAKSSPCFDDSRTYIGSDNGILYALNRSDGGVVWSFKIGRFPTDKGILSSPILYNEMVYFGGYDGVVYALDAETGVEQWRYYDADWVGSSPAISPDTNMIYIGLEFGLWNRRGGIVALDMKTGKRCWQQFHTALTHGSPLVIPEEELVIIGSNNNQVYGYYLKTGTLRFVTSIPGHAKASFVYDKERRLIYGGSVGGAFFAISAVDGSKVQVIPCGGMYGTPIIVGGLVIFGGMDKCIYAYDPTTWTIRWRFETRGRIFATPVAGKEVIWIGSNDGRLCELEVSSGVLTASYQFSERIVGIIRTDPKSGDIFVTTVKNELYCLCRN